MNQGLMSHNGGLREQVESVLLLLLLVKPLIVVTTICQGLCPQTALFLMLSLATHIPSKFNLLETWAD